jgi:tRNA U34 5-methylaminomethyl-2-thiouridine-forming methyltransferase MnmC
MVDNQKPFNENPELITTADGSHTLFFKNQNESYHSRFGALQESKHIFILHGLQAIHLRPIPIKILEIGFGTGLNALLTLEYSTNHHQQIEYTSVEPFPIDKRVIDQLNYPDLLELKNGKDLFLNLHNISPDAKTSITENFIFEKLEKKIQDIILPDESFDLVYFDAFAPDIQPELWENEIFMKLFLSMKKNAILVTYSCKGTVKRALKNAGFKIEKLSGPPGKREFLRAIV